MVDYRARKSPRFKKIIQKMAERKVAERAEQLLGETGHVRSPGEARGSGAGAVFPPAILAEAVKQLQAEATASKRLRS